MNHGMRNHADLAGGSGETAAPKAPLSAENCRSMVDIRAGIDALDKQLVELLTRRVGYIARAAEIKIAEGLPADIPWRVEQVVSKVKDHAQNSGLDPQLAEEVWRLLIRRAIELEERKMAQESGQ